MSDVGTFPTITQVLYNDGPTWTFTAGEAITRGMVVGMAATGTSDTVVCMDKTAGEVPIGVAVNTAASGSKVTVALNGCIVNVANASQTDVIDAGDWVECNDNAVKGTVNAWTPRVTITATNLTSTTSFTIVETLHQVVGQAIEDIAVSSYGKILVNIMSIPQEDITT